MPVSLRPSAVAELLRPGMQVFLPGMSGESDIFYSLVREKPESADGGRFIVVQFPGINRSDFLSLHERARQRGYFMMPELRSGLRQGRFELLPVDHPGIVRDIRSLGSIALLLAHVSPPDEHGMCSLGVSCDFVPVAWPLAKLRFAHVNAKMPRTRGSFQIPYSAFDYAFEADQEPRCYDAGMADSGMRHHADLVAGLVRDGDTVEFGIGKLQTSIVHALAAHQNLQVWSGMATTPIVELLDRGVVRGNASIQLGCALGDREFYDRCSDDDSFYFRPASETHDVGRVSSIKNFCAINSAVEVDLLGQVNSDVVNGKLVAGVGGLPPFISGALASAGGRSVIALPSTTSSGKHSRIVTRLCRPGAVAVNRSSADYVVTEHGVASLRGASIQARAEALIGIASPQWREQLASEWHELLHQL